MMFKTGIYAGSFNPWHKGHQYIYETSQKIFERVVIIKASNPNKKNDSKIQFDMPAHDILPIGKALGEYCANVNPIFVRGVRAASDYDYEFRLAAFNREKFGIETIFIPCLPSLSHLSSSALRELHNLNIDIREYLV